MSSVSTTYQLTDYEYQQYMQNLIQDQEEQDSLSQEVSATQANPQNSSTENSTNTEDSSNSESETTAHRPFANGRVKA